MWLKLVMLTAVTVSSGRINTENFRDHYLAQPKTDFESFRSTEDFGDRGMQSEFNGGFETQKFENPEFYHTGFESEVSHRQFHRSSSGHGDKDSGSQSHFGSEFHRREVENNNNKKTERSFHHKTNVHRGDPAIETLGHDVEADNFGSGTRIHDRSIESHRRNTGTNGFQGFGGEFQSNFGSGDFGSHFQGKSIDSNNHRTINNRFHENSDRPNHEFQSFGTGFNREGDFHDKVAEGDEQKDLAGQINNNKQEFEIISTANRRKFTDENTKHNSNGNGRISANVEMKHSNRDISNQNVKTNDPNQRTDDQNLKTSNHNDKTTEQHMNNNDQSLKTNEQEVKTNDHDARNNGQQESTHIRPENSQNDQNRKTEPHNQYTSTQRPKPSGRDRTGNDTRQSERSYANNTPDNDITSISSNNTLTENKTNRNDPSKDIEGDRWIWGSEKKKEMTTMTPETVTLDDRAAFSGDKCPTGKIKVGNLCVDID